MKAENLRKFTNTELLEMRKDLEIELMKCKIQKGVKSKKPKRTNNQIFKELRKNIARINTILNERKPRHKNKIENYK